MYTIVSIYCYSHHHCGWKYHWQLSSLNRVLNSRCAVLCLVVQSCLTLCNPMDCSLPGSSINGDSPSKNTGVGCHFLLQGIFLTQELNPGLPHCRQILHCLSHQEAQIIGNPTKLILCSVTFMPRKFDVEKFKRQIVLYLKCNLQEIIINFTSTFNT